MSLGLTELALRRRQAQESSPLEYGRRHASTVDFRRSDEARVWSRPAVTALPQLW